MSTKAQLYFIYDCLCPWSYAATPLITEINKHLTDSVEIIMLNSAYFGGTDSPTAEQIGQVKQLSDVNFSAQYISSLTTPQNSTVSANAMAWASKKEPKNALKLLTKLQEAVFQQGLLLDETTLTSILDELKLFAPTKALKGEKLTKDAQFDLGEIEEIQQIIGTNAIPALLLIIGDELVLLNHNLYLKEPTAIVEAINLEINGKN